jgi:1-acyl-sn-glycerol-3-phosphate acyltransferase
MRPVPLWFLEACRPGVRAAARALLRIRFEGVEHVPGAGAVVIAPNHVSYMDPVLVTIPIRRPLHYMALEPFFRVRGLGALIRWCRAFPVQEGEPDGVAARVALRLLRRGEPLVIFPEGGRSPDGRLQPFRPGAFRLALAAGAPVVPVTIAGAFEAWPPSRRLPRPGRVRVTYHPPVDASALPLDVERKAQPEFLMTLVRERMARALPG